MSILIRDMEMPKSCMDCPCFCEEYFYCRVKESDDIGLGKRPKDCPLVPVPPHGRLGDLDALAESVTTPGIFPPVISSVVFTFLRNAPTIIPAEEGE